MEWAGEPHQLLDECINDSDDSDDDLSGSWGPRDADDEHDGREDDYQHGDDAIGGRLRSREGSERGGVQGAWAH